MFSEELVLTSVPWENMERQLSLDCNLLKISVHDERSEVTLTVLFVVEFPGLSF